MINRATDMSQRQASIVAGFGLLVMTVFAVFALFFVFQKIIIPGDAAATVNSIVSNEILFRAGICSFLIVIICDIVVAWALYVFFKPVSNSISVLAAWFRLVYSIIFAVALVNYLSILRFLSEADYLSAIESTQLNSEVMLSINAFTDGWSIGYIFFGLHLSSLGYLALRSGYVPRILGALLIVAGLSYLVDYFSGFMFPKHALNIATFTGWGELLFMFWLLFKGGKIREIMERA